jgi:hypothetical protein
MSGGRTVVTDTRRLYLWRQTVMGEAQITGKLTLEAVLTIS